MLPRRVFTLVERGQEGCEHFLLRRGEHAQHVLLHVRPRLGAAARSLKIELVLVLRFASTHLRQGLGPLADSVGNDLLRLLPLGRRRIDHRQGAAVSEVK